VGRKSGIDEDLACSFSEGDATKIASISRYLIGTDGNTLPRMESWQVMHQLPYSEPITEDIYGDLFKSIGQNEDGVQKYFSNRAARMEQSPVLAFDSTTISTYSENQSDARRGFNKNNDGLNIIKLLTLYSVNASMSSTCPFDTTICGATIMRTNTFKKKKLRTRNDKAAGEIEEFSKRFYIHVFYSPDNQTRKELAFIKELLELKSQLEKGDNEIKSSTKKKVDKYFIIYNKKRVGKLKIAFNDIAIIEAKKYFGYFTLVSNHAMNTFEAF